MSERLKAFIAQMEDRPDIGDGYKAMPGADPKVMNVWCYIKAPYLHDFNRGLLQPGARPDDEWLRDGAVTIRCDDDFHLMATLPWEFVDLSCEEIVATLWPEIDDATFHPDTSEEPNENVS